MVGERNDTCNRDHNSARIRKVTTTCSKLAPWSSFATLCQKHKNQSERTQNQKHDQDKNNLKKAITKRSADFQCKLEYDALQPTTITAQSCSQSDCHHQLVVDLEDQGQEGRQGRSLTVESATLSQQVLA